MYTNYFLSNLKMNINSNFRPDNLSWGTHDSGKMEICQQITH